MLFSHFFNQTYGPSIGSKAFQGTLHPPSTPIQAAGSTRPDRGAATSPNRPLRRRLRPPAPLCGLRRRKFCTQYPPTFQECQCQRLGTNMWSIRSSCQHFYRRISEKNAAFFSLNRPRCSPAFNLPELPVSSKSNRRKRSLFMPGSIPSRVAVDDAEKRTAMGWM